MGSKGGGETTSTNYTTSLPAYAEPYYQRMMTSAEAIANQPYQAYTGQRVAGMTGDQEGATQGIRNIAGAGTPGADQAMGYTDYATQMALSAGQYNPQSVNSNFSASQFGADPVNAATWNNGFAQNYMNPYINNVLNGQEQDLYNNYLQQNSQRQSDAQAASAFGGSRSAIIQSQANKALNQQQTDVRNKGLADAYDNAQQMFTTDRNAVVGTDEYNSDNQLKAQQMADASKQFGASQDLEAQTTNEANRQGALGLGLQGAQLGMTGANQMASIEQNKNAGLMDVYNSLYSAGANQQALQQQGLDTAYNDFVNQRDSDKNNVEWLSGILHGVPTTPNSDTVTSSPTNPLSQAVGTGIAAYGLSKSSTK